MTSEHERLTLCIGWVTNPVCPVYSAAHGCKYPDGHGGHHRCACGASSGKFWPPKNVELGNARSVPTATTRTSAVDRVVATTRGRA